MINENSIKRMATVCILLISLMVIGSSSVSATSKDVSVLINGNIISFNQNSGIPFVDSANRTQVPFRVTLEQYGAKVDWDQDNQVAIATMNGTEVRVPIGKYYIYKNGEVISNDTVALVKDNRTYLPIRAVLEAFGANVAWNQSLGQVVINKPVRPIIIHGVIDPSIPVPDQTNAWPHIQVGDTNVVTTKELCGGTYSTYPNGEYNMARAIKYKGDIYYTVTYLDERGIDFWNGTTSLSRYGINVSRSNQDGGKLFTEYIAIYDKTYGSVDGRGSILIQVYANNYDTLSYGNYGYIRYDLVKELLEQLNLKYRPDDYLTHHYNM